MFITKVKWIENAEKPRKYLTNLEQRSYQRKVIIKLKTTEGEISD